jgi:hypothetical protein
MLVASRDPFHHGEQHASSARADGAAPRFARAMSALQIVGTLLAIPVGIGSAYSMYRANFSVETTCQSLRANIVVMLDKSVDAATRRMLVRRDVESFEQVCGTVDPDATAAFKALLAVDKTPAQIVKATVPRVDAQPKEVTRKAEPRPDVGAKPPAVNAAAAAAPETAPVQRDAVASDAAWLAAVRGALVSHNAEAPAVAPEAVKTSSPQMTETAIRPVSPEVRVVSQPQAPSSMPMTIAPALPPPVPIAGTAATPANADHPVPPAPILGNTPADTAKTDDHERSKFGGLIAQIPVLGPAVDAVSSRFR